MPKSTNKTKDLASSENDRMDLASKIEAHRTLITAEMLASYLDVSRKSIYEWAKAGTLPAMRFGASIRFDPAVTAKWVRARSA